ncbi:type II secretion system protein GspK [Ideonella paludis]|uniref:type II secretion system protein GspK n=1 Tax=Ideonella paludis TaxID=1233411 RepID=UPI0036348478
MPPHRIEQLSWLGLDPEAIKRLAPFVVLLPTATPVNVNSASPEVLVAAIEGLDRGMADRLLRARPAGGYDTLDAVQKQLPEKIKLNQQVSIASTHFEIDGELRYDQYVLRERSLVQRRGLEVIVLRRERLPQNKPRPAPWRLRHRPQYCVSRRPHALRPCCHPHVHTDRPAARTAPPPGFTGGCPPAQGRFSPALCLDG